MKVPPKTSIDHYILLNKILCSVFGISPTDQKYSTCGKIFAYFRFTLALTSAFSIFVPQIMLVVVNWGDLKILTEVGCISMALAQYVFKMIYLAIRRERTYKLYKELRSLWNSADDSIERESYERFAYWAKTSTIILFLLGVCNTIIYSTVAAIGYLSSDHIDNDADRGQYLTFYVWYGTDLSKTSFEITFICQYVATLISSTGLWGIESSCMTTILHVCGQFKLINTWISNIGREINRESANSLPNVKASLIKCIRHHQRMLNVANEVNILLTPIIFFQILTTGLEICLSGFYVTSNEDNMELLKAMFYLTTTIIQLLLWCWSGEILIHKSQEIGQVAYLNVPWYKLPPNYRRQLLLIILRSQKHCCITALTFETLSFHTLTSVFNTAGSYFTLLRQMQET